jgi:hypothetical protein
MIILDFNLSRGDFGDTNAIRKPPPTLIYGMQPADNHS